MIKKITFADIAKKTGYSKATISRYFNHASALSAETQAVIEQAIQELGYRENKLARVLANGRTEIIGVVVPSLYMHYYADLLEKILLAGEEHGYKFIVFSSQEDRETEHTYLSELMAYKVEGLIMVSHVTPSVELAKLGIPVVTIEREDKYVNSVNANNYQGGLAASQHLAETGCEVLIHINGDLSTASPAFGRIRGFRETVQKTGLASREYLQRLGNTYEEIRDGMSAILKDMEERFPHKCKGIFVSNDTAAGILLNLIVQKYGCFPDEFKLVGFDDSPISREAIVPFTTIRQDTRLIAEDAMEMLIRRIEERKEHVPEISKTLVHHVIDTELIIRDTTKKCMKGTRQ
ncbi:MAG: LacI family DNA-binding transcriptional regulator [Solobacterium sp.]|nr:LacI family DNA-binding transcriptional regulator [Solobacterium sp.]